MAAARLSGEARAFFTWPASHDPSNPGDQSAHSRSMKARSSKRHGVLGQRRLEEEHVPAPAELVEGEESVGHRGLGGDRGGDHPPPASGLEGGGAVGGEGAPVVADEHRVVGPAQGCVELAGVDGQGPGVVAAVGRDRGGRIPPHERGHGVEPGIGQAGQEIAPGMGGVGEAVQAQGQRAVARPVLEVGEVDAIGRDVVLVHGAEGSRRAGRSPD